MREAKFLFGLVLIVIVLVAGECECDGDDSIQRRAYLDLPDLSELHAESSPDEELQRVARGVASVVDMSLEPEEVARRIGELVAGQRQGLREGESLSFAWSVMDQLSRYKTTSCSSELIFATRHFLAGLDDKPTYAELKPFLRRSLAELFPRCAREITKGDLRHKSFPLEAINQLRTFLREATGGKGIGPHLAPILRKVNLPETAGQLSLVAMLGTIVRKFGMPKKRKDFTKDIEKVWDKYCADIHAGNYYDNYEIINLANAFGPLFELSTLNDQLSEFHRICTDWRRDEIHQKTVEIWREREKELRNYKEEDEEAYVYADGERPPELPWWQFW